MSKRQVDEDEIRRVSSVAVEPTLQIGCLDHRMTCSRHHNAQVIASGVIVFDEENLRHREPSPAVQANAEYIPSRGSRIGGQKNERSTIDRGSCTGDGLARIETPHLHCAENGTNGDSLLAARAHVRGGCNGMHDSGSAMNNPDSTDRQIDYTVVRRYFQTAGSNTAATASYMAHEQNLPQNAVRYRMRKEIATIAGWLDGVPLPGRVLDLGCGAGTWTKIFADRYDRVVGIEQSSSMVKAARALLAPFPGAEIVEGDGRKDLPVGPYDLIFLGGLCMYLNDPDAVALLRSLKGRLASGASIVLRETTVPHGTLTPRGDYQAVYRSVILYQDLFREAGFQASEYRRNYAYTSMEVAVELVEARRNYLRFLPAQSPFLGALTWYALRATAPLTFWLLPRVLPRLQINWPRLQNHFFRLRSPESS